MTPYFLNSPHTNARPLLYQHYIADDRTRWFWRINASHEHCQPPARPASTLQAPCTTCHHPARPASLLHDLPSPCTTCQHPARPASTLHDLPSPCTTCQPPARPAITLHDLPSPCTTCQPPARPAITHSIPCATRTHRTPPQRLP